jgi:hypothetical protein
MKKGVLIAFICVTILSLSFSISLSEALVKAKTVNSNYMLSGYTLEKINLEYDKAVIEASNKEEEMNAEVTRLEDLIEYYKAYIKEYYSEMIISYLDMRSAQKESEITQLEYLNMKIDNEKKAGLLQKSILSEQEWKESEIDLNDSLDAYEKADIDYKNRIAEYKRYTGFDETTVIDIPTPDYLKFVVSDEIWQKKYKELLSSQLAYDIAKYNVDTLPSSTSAYNRKIATHNLKQKEVSLKIAQITALDDKKELEQTLFYKKRQIENSLKKVTIAESDMKDMNERFKKGLVTESQVNTQRITLLSAEKTLIENQVSYWDAFLDYIIAIDINLDDVVKVSGAK